MDRTIRDLAEGPTAAAAREWLRRHDSDVLAWQRAIAEINRRRDKQLGFNAEHGITPTGVVKRIKDMIDGVYDVEVAQRELKAAQESARYEAMSEHALAKEIRRLEKAMQEHAKNLEFEEAAAARDELFKVKKLAFGGEAHDATAG